VIVIVFVSGPVAEVRQEAALRRREHGPVAAEVPLADQVRPVAELIQELEPEDVKVYTS
jgi:hypothetical protein